MLTPKNYSQDIVELSISAWFYRNRAIAGFDNPARSLYVSVRELMENSLDACEDAQVLPEVTVLLKREEEPSSTDMLSQGPETFELIVKDNGTGIPKKNIDNIFDPFFTTKDVESGTGLGLSITYGIIKEMKGQISVESKINKFTRIKVALPKN